MNLPNPLTVNAHGKILIALLRHFREETGHDNRVSTSFFLLGVVILLVLFRLLPPFVYTSPADHHVHATWPQHGY
jgi:hypothetical protein